MIVRHSPEVAGLISTRCAAADSSPLLSEMAQENLSVVLRSQGDLRLVRDRKEVYLNKPCLKLALLLK